MGFSPMGDGMGIMFTIVPVIIGIGFVVVIGTIIYRAIQGGKEWSSNNNSPVLTVLSKVVAKRMAVSSHNHHSNGMHMHQHHGTPMTTHSTSSSTTTYFATFEVESGDRMELKVPDKEYGILVEGDEGKLTFQGTRYKGFERNRG